MTEIHVLNADVYNKISAGEVIEKPASVVKELVENALDAGATAISISYSGGGLDCIQVTDNGRGIAREDLPLVFMPHATSKIAVAEDLEHIATLGFRGEAMASIAAAAQVQLSTNRDGIGYSINADGGITGDIRPSAIACGTEVIVRNLFYHTPARLKFLRSAKQEGRDIAALCERIIIANPTVRFNVICEGKTLLATLGEGLAEAVRLVYGEENFEHMLPIEADEYGYKVVGFISDTEISAGTRAHQITVLNGRVVTNPNLSASINNAYRDYLMKRNYALFALHITMPADEVDVNVHPTKADVRFVYANKLFGLVYRVVRKALETQLADRDLVFDTLMHAQVEPTTSPSYTPNAGADESDTKQSIPHEISSDSAVPSSGLLFEDSGRITDNYVIRRTWQNIAPKSAEQTAANMAETLDLLPDFSPISEENAAVCINRDNAENAPREGGFDDSALRIAGQVLGTYIVAEYQGELLLIDQHAAAERVLYNRLMKQYASDSLMIQPMLVPYTFGLGEQESGILADRLAEINALGIEITQDDEHTFSLYSMPALLVDLNVMQFVHLLLSDNFEADKGSILREKLAYTACRAAVKGNTYLDNDSLMLLCKNLFAEDLPGQCPHGRPAYVKISRYQLDKMFKRIV